MKGELRKPASVNAILLIGIFTFVFLGAEYLFVNMISLSVTEGRTVIAQNYALGASAVGFFLYPAMERWGGRRYKSALTFILALGAIICTFIVQQHISYAATMTAGMVLFLLLGVFGSAVHYLAAVTIDGDNALARLAGIAYALGILLQYANNNLGQPGGCGGGVSFGIPGGFEPAGHPNETGRPKPHRNDGDCGRLFGTCGRHFPHPEKTDGGHYAGAAGTADGLRVQHTGQCRDSPSCERDGYRAVAPPAAGIQRPRRRLCLRYPQAEVYGAYYVLRDDDVGSVHCGTEPGRSVPDRTGVFILSSGFFVVLFTASFMELSGICACRRCGRAWAAP